VAVFPFFISINSKYYQKPIILDKKMILISSMKNDDVLLTNGLCRKTVEIQELCEQENDKEQGFRLIRRRLQNTWILFCKNTITFRDLRLSDEFVYSNNGKKCEGNDKFDSGMPIIRYVGRLLGGVRHFVDRMFECFAIFSSIDKIF
jgi:hypothetical protein